MHNEKLLHLLKKKRGFFESILDLTESEGDLPVSEWIASMEQKQILLSCVDEVDEAISSFKASIRELSQDASEEMEEIRKVIRHILHIDGRNQEKRKRELKP